MMPKELNYEHQQRIMVNQVHKLVQNAKTNGRQRGHDEIEKYFSHRHQNGGPGDYSVGLYSQDYNENEKSVVRTPTVEAKNRSPKLKALKQAYQRNSDQFDIKGEASKGYKETSVFTTINEVEKEIEKRMENSNVRYNISMPDSLGPDAQKTVPKSSMDFTRNKQLRMSQEPIQPQSKVKTYRTSMQQPNLKSTSARELAKSKISSVRQSVPLVGT